MAGDRTLALNVGRAQDHYARALELVPPEHGQRPAVLLKWAEAARQTGRIADAVRALEEAVGGFRAQGDRVAAGWAMGTLSSVLNAAGSQRHARVAAEAVRLLEEGGAGPEDLVAAYARMAGVALVVGDMRETIAWADRAAALGAGRGLEVPARALGFRGSARCALGDPAGLEELRAALALALERGEGRDTAVLFNNLGDALLPVEGPAGVLTTYREGIRFARRRGIGELAAAMAAGSLDRLIEVGEWDRALADAEALADRAEAEGNVSELLLLRRAQVRVLLAAARPVRPGRSPTGWWRRHGSRVGPRRSSAPSPPPPAACWRPVSRTGRWSCSPRRRPPGPTSPRRRCTRPACPRWPGRPRTPATQPWPSGWWPPGADLRLPPVRPVRRRRRRPGRGQGPVRRGRSAPRGGGRPVGELRGGARAGPRPPRPRPVPGRPRPPGRRRAAAPGPAGLRRPPGPAPGRRG